jgi:hypothetical protein
MLHFDREKYIQIMREGGIAKALTALHLDTERWEADTFEGVDGYQPEMFQDLKGVREFSRELWEMSLKQTR